VGAVAFSFFSSFFLASQRRRAGQMCLLFTKLQQFFTGHLFFALDTNAHMTTCLYSKLRDGPEGL